MYGYLKVYSCSDWGTQIYVVKFRISQPLPARVGSEIYVFHR